MRRVNDFYPTPEWATELLLAAIPLISECSIFECCSGRGAIADVLERQGDGLKVWRNDIDREMPKLHWAYDMTKATNWRKSGFSWIITNPPFNAAAQIVPLAYEHARTGIAMLLRLSFLEPVEDRGAWLSEHPPTKMIVLPRISFTGNGKTDSVTCAWMIWEKGEIGTITVAENPKFAMRQHSPLFLEAGA